MATTSVSRLTARLERWLLTKIEQYPTRLLRDVIVRPSVGPLTAWLVGGLIVLVGWLAYKYAPIEHGGIISVGWGYATIGMVALIAVSAGAEPVAGWRLDEATKAAQGRLRPLSRALDDWIGKSPRGLARGSKSGLKLLDVSLARFLLGHLLKFALGTAMIVVQVIWRFPSWVFSLVDWAIVHPFALLAGVRLKPWWMRYGWMIVVITGAVWAAFAFTDGTGLWFVIVALIAIVAVVRRWQWVERDREA